MNRTYRLTTISAGAALATFLCGCVYYETTYDGLWAGSIKNVEDRAQLMKVAGPPDAHTSDGRFLLYDFTRARTWMMTDLNTFNESVGTTRKKLRVLYEHDMTGQVINSIIHDCKSDSQEPICADDLDAAMQAMLEQHYDPVTIKDTRRRSAIIDAHADEWFSASSQGDIEEMQHLLTKGMPVELQREGRTALHVAAAMDDIPAVSLLLHHGAPADFRETEKGWTALHIASRHDNRELASLLIEFGADTNLADFSVSTPLHHAARVDAVSVATLLVASGAELTVADIDNMRPLDYAVVNGYIEMLGVLLEGGAKIDGHGITPVSRAAEHGQMDVVKFLVDNGADINKGHPVFEAVQRGDYSIVEYLLSHGADANREGVMVTSETPLDWRRARPLELARINGRDDIAALLVQYGGEE